MFLRSIIRAAALFKIMSATKENLKRKKKEEKRSLKEKEKGNSKKKKR